MIGYYLNSNTFAKLEKKFKRHKIKSMLKKHSKDGNVIDEIIDELEMFRNTKATLVNLRTQNADK